MGTEADASSFRSLFEQKERELVRMCVQKEKELVEICEQQVKNLQQQVVDRDKNIADLNAKFCSLKEDFKYNLDLLDGRDVELSQYESELSALQELAKQTARNIQEAHDKLAESERQRLQERSKTEEKDKLYHRTLLDMKGQMESLQLTKEQLLTKHKQEFDTACAELKSQIEIKQADMELHSKRLEAHTLERIRVQELQSQLVLDGVKNKLSLAETTIKDMERKREAADLEYSQSVAELRDIIRGKDKIIKQMSAEMHQLQCEKDDIKAKADLDNRNSIEKLQQTARQQALQMKSQIDDLQRRLESAENRLTQFGEQCGQLASYVAKVGEIEKEVMRHGNEMNMKIESVEAAFREEAQLQDQKVQESKAEVAWWKSQHDVLLSKYTWQQRQKQLTEGSAMAEVKTNLSILQVPQVDTIGTKQDISTTTNNLERIKPSLTNIPLPHGRGSRGTSNSFGSSLPSPSPLPSPTFSNLEELLQLRPVNQAIQTNKPENDVVTFSTEDDCKPQTSERDDENFRPVSLATENQDLRNSLQNLKRQNEQMRSVVGAILADMEVLRKASLQNAETSTNIEGLSTKCEQNEIRQLREEVHHLASELQNLHLKRPDEKTLKLGDQMADTFQNSESKCDKSKSVSDDIQPAAAKIAELERVQKVLQIQLESATADIIRMTNERDCLMEISNSLHADLNRFVQHSNVKNDILHLGHHGNLHYSQNPTRNVLNTGGATTICSHRPHSSPQKIPHNSIPQRLSSPTRQDGGGGLEPPTTTGSKQSKQGVGIRTQSRSMQPMEVVDEHTSGSWLHLEGKMTSLTQRPEALPDYVHKGVPSQRNKLKQSIKWRETQLAKQIASRPRVRNFNIKDDDAFNSL